MNILFNNATTTWGGIKTWMLELASFLQTKGHHPLMVCREHDLLVERAEERGLNVQTMKFGPDYSPSAINKFLKIFQSHQTELLITNITKGVRTAGVAAKMKGIPHINRLGNYGDLKDSRRVEWEYNMLVQQVIVPSQGLYNHFIKKDFLKDKMNMFNNAVRVPDFHLNDHKILKFAVVANLTPRKQVDRMIDAFHQLRDLPWELHIAGFGPELERLKKMTADYQLSERVLFPGTVKSIEFMQGMDVGILYSTQEGLPWSLLEYMAASCTPIVSNIEGIPEVIQNDSQGILVDPDDLDSLIDAVKLCIQDRSMVKRVAEQGYQRVKGVFSQEKVFSGIETFFQETIQNHRKSR